jgi:RHS repeat-associated protein
MLVLVELLVSLLALALVAAPAAAGSPRRAWSTSGTPPKSTTVQVDPGPALLETFTYTPGGTLLAAGGQTYVPGSETVSPQAVVQVNGPGGAQRALSYDLDGFATADADLTLSFDARGCLISTARGTAARVDRICGDDGGELFRRTTEVAGGVTTTSSVIDVFGLAEVRPEDDTMTLRVKVNGTAIAEEVYDRFGARRADKSRVIHTDMRGSVLLTSVDGASPTEREAIEYDAWGASIAGTPALPVHRFVDHEPDLFGNYVFGKRVYSPTLRRWLSADPLIAASPEVDASGRQLDLYAYAANNPVKVTDRTGMYGEMWHLDADPNASGVSNLRAGTPQERAAIAAAGGIAGGAVGAVVVGAVVTAYPIVGLALLLGATSTTVKNDVDTAIPLPSLVDPVLAAAAAGDAIASGNPEDAQNAGFALGGTVGGVAGSRAGKDFTRAGRHEVKVRNVETNGGVAICESCGIGMVPAKKSMKGEKPAPNEIQIDHKKAKSKGGSGTVENGDALCRTCNRAKSDK